MCWQDVSVDMLANGLCGVVLCELLAHSHLFTTIMLCPKLTSGFCSAYKKKYNRNFKKMTGEEGKGGCGSKVGK